MLLERWGGGGEGGGGEEEEEEGRREGGRREGGREEEGRVGMKLISRAVVHYAFYFPFSGGSVHGKVI